MLKNYGRKLLFILSFVFSGLSADTVNLFIVGTGVVGSELLHQIEQKNEKLQKEQNVDFCLVGLANSRTMRCQSSGISVANWKQELDSSQIKMSWNQFLEGMLSCKLDNCIFVDCTSDQTIASSYEKILHAGISIVTPSKKANSASLAGYQRLKTASYEGGAQFYYDANVGAGLPVLHTIKSLKRSGDEIIKIEGVFSGTLSYLFNTFENGMTFSELVKQAQNNGYTEPDPRDDLNGMDVARKLLIAVREAGFQLEMQDIELVRFLPDDCFEAKSVADFYQKLQASDSVMAQLLGEARNSGKRLRYIASFENGHARVSLQAVESTHAFYSLGGCDNIAAITTQYYSTSPVVIRGPGAGASVTAARVLENIILAACRD